MKDVFFENFKPISLLVIYINPLSSAIATFVTNLRPSNFRGPFTGNPRGNYSA